MAGSAQGGFTPHPNDLESGTRIGRYEIDQIVGRGGMGTVYRAFDAETKREVAVKVLHPGQAEELRERFLAECEAEAKIRHPHVMPVYDRGKFNKDRLYFVMELVYEPITLSDVIDANLKGLLAQRWPRLRQWASTPRLVQDVFIPIAEGIDAANREFGLLHRDLKPDNILIDVRTRRAYVIDFGICYELGKPVEEGKIYGTPRFLSPEQVTGKIGDRTDVWGLGAILYFILSGRPPIDASSPMRKEERETKIAELKELEEEARAQGDETRAVELAARRTALANPKIRTVEDIVRDARAAKYPPLPENVPQAPRAIAVKAMAKDPADRYANAGEMVDDLRAWVTGGRVEALAEQHAAGAAVAAAQRTMRRHVVTALWVLLGLVLGLPFGARFLGPEDPGVKARIADAATTLEQLTSEIDGLAGLPETSVAGAARWKCLKAELDALALQVAALPEGADRTKTGNAVNELRARAAAPVLTLEGGAGRQWRVLPPDSPVGADGTHLQKSSTPLPPGLYWLESNRTHLPVVLPLSVAPSAERGPVEVRVDVSAVPKEIPKGMVFVPAGRPTAQESEVPSFLVGTSEVTYLEYAEWVAEIEETDRAVRLPAEGFEPDPDFEGHFLVKREYEDRAITGIRPRDAAAFAAWRAEIDGVPLRLPTEGEWRLAAGSALLSRPYASLFRPLEQMDGAGVRPDRTPYYALGLRTRPAELVRVGEGFGVKAESDGVGIRAAREDYGRTRTVAADEVVAASFRLVQPLE